MRPDGSPAPDNARCAAPAHTRTRTGTGAHVHAGSQTRVHMIAMFKSEVPQAACPACGKRTRDSSFCMRARDSSRHTYAYARDILSSRTTHQLQVLYITTNPPCISRTHHHHQPTVPSSLPPHRPTLTLPHIMRSTLRAGHLQHTKRFRVYGLWSMVYGLGIRV